MPIISVSRWSIDPEVASRIVRDVAPLLRNHGAQRVILGRVVAGQGPHVGQTQTGGQAQECIVSVTYPNWEAFGRAMEAQQNDTALQGHHNTALKSGQMLGRSIIAAEEIQ